MFWPSSKRWRTPSTGPGLWTYTEYGSRPSSESTKATSRFGATREVGKQLAGVRRELARIVVALWALMILAALALCTWYVQLTAAAR